MKTILVPTQDIPAMKSTLETAVLLAQRNSAYVEGVPLWFGVPEFVVAELSSSFSIETYRARRDEGTAGARKLFETFMQEHGIAAARTIADQPSFSWFAEVPPGEDFVGSYGRAFDVTVMSRPDANSTGLHHPRHRIGLFESGRPVLLAPPSRSETDRDQHHDPLERQYRAGPRQCLRHAAVARSPSASRC